MFAGVGDMVGQKRQPLQRVQSLEVPTERGIHAGAVQHGLLAVEPPDREAIPPLEARPIHSGAPDDELLERERIPDDVTRHVLDGLLILELDRLADMGREARMPPSQEPPSEILRDRVSFDETGQQALAEKFHDRVSVPGLERAKGAIVRERAVGHEKVTVRMPLQEVAGAGDGDHDAGPRLRSDLSLHVLGDGLRRALREIEKELATPAEDSAEEARHGEDDVTMRDRLEHFLLQPLRPQELLLLFA